MLYCTNCRVHISTKTDYCPLCHQRLAGSGEECVQTFPKMKKPLSNKRKIAKISFNVACPLIMGITVLVNLLTYNGVLWSIIDILGLMYLWIFGMWSFGKDAALGKKIIVNTIAINILIVGINIFGYNLATLPNHFWSLTYVVPFVMIAGMLASNIASFVKSHSIKDFFFSQVSICFMAIGIFVLGVCGFVTEIYPVAILLTIALITLMRCMLTTKGKVIQEELRRKFYF